MKSEWKECTLKEIINFKNGKKKPVEEGIIPVYGGNGVLGYVNQFNLRKGIAIGRVGAYCGSVYYSNKECWISDNAIQAINNNNSDMLFDYYLLKFLRLNERRIGTGQPLLTQEILNRIEIKCPPLQIQRKIASILSILDDKIELNNKINENLEQQAQAIFKSWFVDFEPFGGVMPEDWQDISVYDLADYINGAAFKKAEYGDYGLPIIKIAELKSGITDSTQYCCVSKDDKYYIDDKDILFSWSGNPDTSIDTFLWSRGKAILNQHTFRVVSKYRAPAFTYFLLKYLKPQFTHIASNKQTTGLGHVTVADLKRLQFCTNETAIADFEELTASIFEKLFAISKENQYLATLRDTLLPKLMNGEIDVSKVKIERS